MRVLGFLTQAAGAAVQQVVLARTGVRHAASKQRLHVLGASERIAPAVSPTASLLPAHPLLCSCC